MTPDSITTRNRRRTPQGLVRHVFNNQRLTSRRAGRPEPTYTYKQLEDWFLNHPNFQKLYNAWVASDYDRNLSPSVDRKDNTLGYSFNNIELMTWRQNLTNQKTQNMSCEFLTANSKGVSQLDMEGNLIETFKSISNALRSIRGKSVGVSNVASAANGNLPHAYGFRWAWA